MKFNAEKFRQDASSPKWWAIQSVELANDLITAFFWSTGYALHIIGINFGVLALFDRADHQGMITMIGIWLILYMVITLVLFVTFLASGGPRKINQWLFNYVKEAMTHGKTSQ